jgi:5'-3' exoribonuclease 2
VQVVFQPQKDDKPLLQQEARARMHARNDPSAPPPVEHPKEDRKVQIAKKPYQFLLVSRLREYLAYEFKIEAPFPVDMERVYDDFGEEVLSLPSSWPGCDVHVAISP